MSEGTEWVFFVDTSLGSFTVAEALRALGLRVEIHKDHFKADEEDVVWLATVSERGWVVLTKDGRILRRPLERDAIIRSKARFFAFNNASAPGHEVAAGFATAIRRMLRILDRNDPPFAAIVDRAGRVEIKDLNSGARQRYTIAQSG